MSKKPFKETKFGKFITETVKPIAGDVLNVVGDITGVEALEKVGDLLNAKRQDSVEAAAAAALFEEKKLEFELEFAKLEMEQYKAETERLQIELADTQSARTREIDMVKATGGKRDWLMGVTVVVALVMYIGGFLFLAYGPVVPSEKKDLFNMAVGQVLTFAGMVFSYYLGTTRSSRQKDDIIKKHIQ